MADILKLTPSETFEFVTTALACRQVAYIAGPPAIGKSQVVAQVAHYANAKMIDIRLSQILSEDMTGLPERDPKTGKATYLPFDMFPLEGDKIPEGYSGWIIFLDELSSASEEVLAAAYSLILDHMVGGKKLHPKCLIVAAGNRATDSAIARELPDTLITRMLPIEMKVSHTDWVAWAENAPNRNDAVVGFLKKNTDMLYSPTKAKDRKELETYPTPRGWEKVFAHINFHEKQAALKAKAKPREDAAGIPIPGSENAVPAEPLSELIFSMMAAAVGSMAARSFREDYDEAIQLPYTWEIAQSPASSRVPNTHVGKVQITQQLADYFLQVDNQSREGVMQYMNRLGGEYAAFFYKHIEDKLGSTASDKRLVEQVASRLNIDPLLGTTTGSAQQGNGGQANNGQAGGGASGNPKSLFQR